MAKRGMAVIGLTGGIGSGKSTVAARMRRAGVPVIDADRVAREIVEPGSPALVEIERVFGAEVIATDGSLRRKALGAIVFSDPEKLATLNRITHPAILRLTQRRLADLASAGHPWAVYEAALILENGLSPGLDQLVAVVCDPNRQLERVMKRDGLSETDASARIASQTGKAGHFPTFLSLSRSYHEARFHQGRATQFLDLISHAVIGKKIDERLEIRVAD